MLTKCPLPKGREKAPLTQDERRSVAQRFKNVVAEQREFVKAAAELDDARFTKRVTDARNTVVRAQKKVDELEARITVLGASDKAVKKNLDLVKAESKALDESVAAQGRIENALNDLYTRFYAANPEITPQMVLAYEKVFNIAKTTTDPAVLKANDVALRQMERAMEAEVKGSIKQLEEVFKNRNVQTRNYNTQLERTRVIGNRVKNAQKKLVNEINKTDKVLAKQLDQSRKALDGAIVNRDALEAVATRYNDRMRKLVSDKFEAQAVRDEFYVKMSEAVDLDPRQGRGVLDWVRSKLGYSLELVGAQLSGKVRLSLQRAGYLAENIVNQVGDVVQIKTLIDFRRDFARAADELGITPKQRQVLMSETIEKGQIPNFLTFFDPDNAIVKEVQRARYDKYVEEMIDAGFTITQIDDFVNGAVRVSKVADDIRIMGKAMGVNIDSLEPFLGYMTRIFSLDGNFFRRRVIDASEVSGNVLPVGKDTKFQFDISRKYDFLVPQDLDIAVDILQVSKDDLLAMIENPIQLQLFMEANLTPAQIDSLLNVGFFQKLPMSTRDVYDYLMAQYQLPFNSAADMFELDIVENLQKYSRAIGDQANISRMISSIVGDEDGVKLGWSVPVSAYEADKLLPVEKRQYANFVNMEDKMLEWTSRLGLTAEIQEKLGKMYMHPVVADQVIAILDITKSPALLGQSAGIIGWTNKFFSGLKRYTLASSAPVYLANQVLSNVIQSHAAGANILGWVPAVNELVRVVRGEGLDHIDNTVKRYEIDGKQMTRREVFLWTYENHGTATTSMFGDRGRPSLFKAKDAARDILSNSSAFVYRLMQYTFGTGELTGGKTLNSMERVMSGIEYFSANADKVLGDITAPIFYTANLVDFTSKYNTILSTAKRIDGGNPFDVGATYMFSQSFKQFDTTEALNKHIRAYFPDMRDVGSAITPINNYFSMFFSWQASMMPRVLRDVMRRPWRYAAYERLRQFTAEPLKEDDSVTEAGISPDVLKGMPYYIGRGKEDGKLIFWNDESYNAATSTFNFIRTVTGNTETSADKRGELQGQFRNDLLVKALESAYAPAKIVYELASNTNLRTGRALRREDGRGVPLLGFEVPPELFSVINNAVPVLGALDRLDIEALSGTPTIRDNNGNIVEKGTRGAFGFGVVPNDSGRLQRKRELDNAWVQGALALIGGKLRVVDMARQNKITYNDVSRSLDIVTKRVDSETQSLKKDELDGVITKGSKEYQQRAINLDKLVVTREQLQMDEDMVYLWLNERGLLTDKEIKQKYRYMIELQQKGVHPAEAAVQRSAERLLRWRQEWSIPQYGKEETQR